MGMASRICSGVGLVRVFAVVVVLVGGLALASGQGDSDASGLRPDGQPRASVPTLTSPKGAESTSSNSTKKAAPPISAPHFGAVDAVINAAIQDGTIPGAVLVVGHDGRVIYRKAYGARALEPRREVMTLDTIFDVASLTKVIATTTAVM